MTTTEVVDGLLQARWLDAFAIPSFAPLGWWENDVFELTKAGLWNEFEVKVSRADYIRDAGKRKWIKLLGAPGQHFNKHELLARRNYEHGPNRFWFVFTEAVAFDRAEIPLFAGVMVAVRERRGIRFRVVNKAPKLHGGKVSEAVRRDAEAVCYYRWHRARSSPSSPEFRDGAGI